MRKLLIFITAAATLISSGCSTVGDGLRSLGSITNIVPDALDRAPLVYRPEIQQGNVVSQEQVNELKPGMSKRQVRFLLGSPMLTDVFHDNRWDYTYTFGKGSTPEEMRKVTVFFENDRLTRISGDMRPQPESEREAPKKEILVTVPDWEPEEKSLWRRAIDTVGLGDN
ncbi:MAG: outer membrane protein assembly factor BamE [Gammaproteobacteria bacterium]|nr:outer membrane protein assembly factor BamE [Gammaproteobacteria bacterium]